MKKYLLIGILFLTACQSSPDIQSALPDPTFTPVITAARFTPTAKVVPLSPTAIPSPTSSATPLPPERYFTEEFDIAPDYWSTLYSSGNSDRVDIFNENSALTFELYNTNAWIYAIYGAFEYESVHLETFIKSGGSDINAMGLVCHYDEQDGWYEFNISSDGTYNLLYGQWLAEGIARYTPILNDASERINTGKTGNQVGFDCYDETLQFYINDKLIRKLNVAHIGLTGGKVGITLASFEQAPVILSFDWVTVSEMGE